MSAPRHPECGPARRPLRLEMPVFVSDMGFGPLSEEAEPVLAKGAEPAGTSRVPGREARQPGSAASLQGRPAVSPSRFPGWEALNDIRAFASEVRERAGGIPMGYKRSAWQTEGNLDAAAEIGIDSIIPDGRGGGTGSAPLAFHEHISVPTLPALALGADRVAIANSALQAVACPGMRACHPDMLPGRYRDRAGETPPAPARCGRGGPAETFSSCPGGVDEGPLRACARTYLDHVHRGDLTTRKRELAHLTGVRYGGVTPL